MKQYILTAVITAICSYGFLAMAASQALSAEQVKQVYISIQAGH